MSRQAKILVVDDTPEHIAVLKDLLVVNGYGVAMASSGADALKQLEQEQPDLVLLDVVMPGMNGYEVCQKIRENPDTAFIPVVMVTALDAVQGGSKESRPGRMIF